MMVSVEPGDEYVDVVVTLSGWTSITFQVRGAAMDVHVGLTPASAPRLHRKKNMYEIVLGWAAETRTASYGKSVYLFIYLFIYLVISKIKYISRGGSRNFHLGRPVKGQANFG